MNDVYQFPYQLSLVQWAMSRRLEFHGNHSRVEFHFCLRMTKLTQRQQFHRPNPEHKLLRKKKHSKSIAGHDFVSANTFRLLSDDRVHSS